MRPCSGRLLGVDRGPGPREAERVHGVLVQRAGAQRDSARRLLVDEHILLGGQARLCTASSAITSSTSSTLGSGLHLHRRSPRLPESGIPEGCTCARERPRNGGSPLYPVGVSLERPIPGGTRPSGRASRGVDRRRWRLWRPSGFALAGEARSCAPVRAASRTATCCSATASCRSLARRRRGRPRTGGSDAGASGRPRPVLPLPRRSHPFGRDRRIYWGVGPACTFFERRTASVHSAR